MKQLLLSVAFSGLLGGLYAQCPQFIQCTNVLPDKCITGNNQAEFWNQNSFLDPVHNQTNLAEGSVSLSMSVKDTCGASTRISYVLLIDLDGNGSRETAVWSDSLPPAGRINMGNAANPNFSGGQTCYFDTRTSNTNYLYRFALQTIAQGDTLTAHIRFHTSLQPNNYIDPILPLGNYEIRWYIASGGVMDTCVQFFEVVDCQKPTVVCSNPITVSINPNAVTAPLWVSELFLYAIDNTCPPDQLTTGMRKAGAGTGFPLDSLGNPVNSIEFTCNDVGIPQPMEIWALDKFGNTNVCTMTVSVVDNQEICGPVINIISCAYNHCNNEPVTNVNYEIISTSIPVPQFVFTELAEYGCLEQIMIPLNNSAIFTPIKDDNSLNGVSTFDLVLIQKHIMNVDMLNSPYKLIAADANKNGSITATDITEFRKLILGIYSDLPNNTSWRFIPQSFNFVNPMNPFTPPFPEFVPIAAPGRDFIGIKIGDVNCSNQNAAGDDHDPRQATLLSIRDEYIAAGQLVSLPVQATRSGAFHGFQLALATHDAELISCTPGNLPDFSDDNYRLQSDAMRLSWANAQAASINAGQTLFTLQLRANRGGYIHELLGLEISAIRPEAYPADGSIERMDLVFATSGGLHIGQAIPNPVQNDFEIPVFGAAGLPVRLELWNSAGMLLGAVEDQVSDDSYFLRVPGYYMSEAGIYFWKMQAGDQFVQGRVVKQ